jgi:hypothetical protein
MPILILAVMVVFAPGLVFFLIHLGQAIIEGISPIAYAVMLLVGLLFARYGAIWDWNWTRTKWTLTLVGCLVALVSVTLLHG